MGLNSFLNREKRVENGPIVSEMGLSNLEARDSGGDWKRLVDGALSQPPSTTEPYP